VLLLLSVSLLEVLLLEIVLLSERPVLLDSDSITSVSLLLVVSLLMVLLEKL
jgi:hypothetical protein